MQTKVCGEQAKQIKEGQKFIARITSVEGRTIAILEPEEKIRMNFVKNSKKRCNL